MDWCQNKCVKIELVINDWGMAGLIRKKYPNQFLLTLGCLLSKQRRDTRMNYVNRNDNEFSKEKSQIDAPFYRQYLAKPFNITRVSFQNSGIDQSFFTARQYDWHDASFSVFSNEYFWMVSAFGNALQRQQRKAESS